MDDEIDDGMNDGALRVEGQDVDENSTTSTWPISSGMPAIKMKRTAEPEPSNMTASFKAYNGSNDITFTEPMHRLKEENKKLQEENDTLRKKLENISIQTSNVIKSAKEEFATKVRYVLSCWE